MTKKRVQRIVHCYILVEGTEEQIHHPNILGAGAKIKDLFCPNPIVREKALNAVFHGVRIPKTHVKPGDNLDDLYNEADEGDTGPLISHEERIKVAERIIAGTLFKEVT